MSAKWRFYWSKSLKLNRFESTKILKEYTQNAQSYFFFQKKICMWFGNLINFNIESCYHIILSSRNSFSIVITQLYFSISIAPIEHIINYPIFFHFICSIIILSYCLHLMSLTNRYQVLWTFCKCSRFIIYKKIKKKTSIKIIKFIQIISHFNWFTCEIGFTNRLEQFLSLE